MTSEIQILILSERPFTFFSAQEFFGVFILSFFIWIGILHTSILPKEMFAQKFTDGNVRSMFIMVHMDVLESNSS